MNKLSSAANEISASALARLISAAAGFALLGPLGLPIAIVAQSIVEDVTRQLLSPREINRMELVIKYAVESFSKKIKHGSKPRKDFNQKKYKELFEGTLLKARVSYEEKKIPLLGNLFATAPFTSTPVENINQTLIYAEQLSYRQLCIISVVGTNEWRRDLKLTDKPLIRQNKKNFLDEKIEGVYADMNHLLALGILGQELTPGSGPAIPSGMYLISPASLKLLYPGRLLNNGMLLGDIQKEDRDEVISILRKS